MQIQTQCQCGAKFAFSKEQVGQAFRCSVCHQVFHVPAPGEKMVMAPASDYVPPPGHAPPKYPGPAPARRSSGSGMGCLVCAFVLFVLIALGGIATAWFAAAGTATTIRQSLDEVDRARQMAKRLERLADHEKLIPEYTNQGYEEVVRLGPDHSGTIENKTLFTARALNLHADSKADLALLSQVVTLNGDIDGNVDFYGQSLTIEKDAVIHGDVNLGFAQLVVIRGKVEGKLTGGYQSLVGEDNVKGGLDPQGGLIDLTGEDWGEDFGFDPDAVVNEVIDELERSIDEIEDKIDN